MLSFREPYSSFSLCHQFGGHLCQFFRLHGQIKAHHAVREAVFGKITAIAYRFFHFIAAVCEYEASVLLRLNIFFCQFIIRRYEFMNCAGYLKGDSFLFSLTYGNNAHRYLFLAV